MPQPPITEISLKNYLSKLLFKSPRGQWVNSWNSVWSADDLVMQGAKAHHIIFYHIATRTTLKLHLHSRLYRTDVERVTDLVISTAFSETNPSLVVRSFVNSLPPGDSNYGIMELSLPWGVGSLWDVITYLSIMSMLYIYLLLAYKILVYLCYGTREVVQTTHNTHMYKNLQFTQHNLFKIILILPVMKNHLPWDTA